MDIVVTHGNVVTGDGTSFLQGVDVLISQGRVAAIGRDLSSRADETIDAHGCLVLPGLVNVHTHGVTPGPLMPSGGMSLPRWNWMANLDRHLLHGTTAVLNLCGLATMTMVREADRAHGIRVAGATTHEPRALAAAVAADGAGLSEEITTTTVAEQIAQGAVAIGELGGGQTLAGGGQDLVYLPAALSRLGVHVEPEQARVLKDAVLGRRLEHVARTNSAETLDRVAAALRRTSLDGSLSPETALSVVVATVMPSVGPALDGIREGVRLSAVHQVPAFVHSAAATSSLLTELATSSDARSARVVASHVNHVSYRPDEAVEIARLGREAGWTNEACVFDLLVRREMVTEREQWDGVVGATDQLVDVIATDYGPGGRHDGLLDAVSDLVTHHGVGLPRAVAMVSSAPADLVPGLTPARGRIQVGLPADLVVVDRSDLTRVRRVVVDGRTVAVDGQVVAARDPLLSPMQFDRLEKVVGPVLARADEAAVAVSSADLRRGVAALDTWMAP